MKFEEAIALLRQGKKIYRSSDREKGYLKGTINKWLNVIPEKEVTNEYLFYDFD